MRRIFYIGYSAVAFNQMHSYPQTGMAQAQPFDLENNVPMGNPIFFDALGKIKSKPTEVKTSVGLLFITVPIWRYGQ